MINTAEKAAIWYMVQINVPFLYPWVQVSDTAEHPIRWLAERQVIHPVNTVAGNKDRNWNLDRSKGPERLDAHVPE